MSKVALLVLLAGTLGARAFAQADKPAAPTSEKKFYRLDFTVRELDGDKIVNSRSYFTMFATEHQRARIRAGSRVPMKFGISTENIDVGVDIDASEGRELNSELALWIVADVSSVAAGSETATTPPVTRHNRWESPVILPLRRSTTLFSSDDPASKHKMQLALTATPIP